MHFGFNPLVKYLIDIRDIGLEWTASRYYGLYSGEVAPFKNSDPKIKEDPQGQSRLCVKVGILGVGTSSKDGKFDPTPIERCALPASIYAGKDHGMYFPPEVGSSVWVSFDHGDADRPRVHGSWWKNLDPNLKSSGSEVPAEFRLDRNGKEIKGIPTRRGTKTKFGHGMIYSDEAASPYVAIWSGNQEAVGPGKPARITQQITLSDGDGDGAPPTVKGVDGTVQKGIYANTIEGLRLALNDTSKYIMISGLRADAEGIDANSIKIEDQTAKITVKTKGVENMRHEVILDDTKGKITVKTKNAQPQTIVMDSNSGNIEITSPLDTVVTTTGAFNVMATAASTHAFTAALTRTVGATFTDTITGAWTATAASLNLTGSATASLTSLLTTVTGNAILSLVGAIINITAPVITLAAPVVIAGTGAPLPLINTLGLAKFNSHIHLVVGPFPGITLVPLVPMIPGTPSVPGDTTVALLGA